MKYDELSPVCVKYKYVYLCIFYLYSRYFHIYREPRPDLHHEHFLHRGRRDEDEAVGGRRRDGGRQEAEHPAEVSDPVVQL